MENPGSAAGKNAAVDGYWTARAICWGEGDADGLQVSLVQYITGSVLF
jgi:hypothetical protein